MLYLLLVFVLSFPLNVYEHFFREHQYGLATQSFPAWFREQLIGLGITLIGGTIFLIVLLRCFPASTENVVDLGNRRRRCFLVCFGLHRAGIHRAALQYV